MARLTACSLVSILCVLFASRPSEAWWEYWYIEGWWTDWTDDEGALRQDLYSLDPIDDMEHHGPDIEAVGHAIGIAPDHGGPSFFFSILFREGSIVDGFVVEIYFDTGLSTGVEIPWWNDPSGDPFHSDFMITFTMEARHPEDFDTGPRRFCTTRESYAYAEDGQWIDGGVEDANEGHYGTSGFTPPCYLGWLGPLFIASSGEVFDLPCPDPYPLDSDGVFGRWLEGNMWIVNSDDWAPPLHGRLPFDGDAVRFGLRVTRSDPDRNTVTDYHPDVGGFVLERNRPSLR